MITSNANTDMLAKAWSHGAGKHVVLDPHGLHADPALPSTRPMVPLTRLGPHGDVWTSVLQRALAPSRWDDWSNYNDHRPYPSPRAKHAHRVWLDFGDGPRLLDEVRCTVEELTTPAFASATKADWTTVRCAIQGVKDRIPVGYGALSEALVLLEVGHVSEALMAAAREHGIRSSWRVDPTNGGAVVELSLPSGTRRPGRSARRCSGLDPRGLAADPRPMPISHFSEFLAGAPVTDKWLRHRLAVHNIADHADGVWEATLGGLVQRSSGSATAIAARGFRAPAGVVDFAGMNVMWAISTSVVEQVTDRPEAYPESLIRAGIVGQRICEAAARAGLFCRPVRGFEEPDLEAVFGLEVSEDLLYLFLIGRPRVSGFTYDLSAATPEDAFPSTAQENSDERIN